MSLNLMEANCKSDIAFMLRLILECDTALRECFLAHWQNEAGQGWVDCAESGKRFWDDEEAHIESKPKNKQWRPMSFVISSIRRGDSRMWDITVYSYVLLKSSRKLPEPSVDRSDIMVLIELRNKCSHAKPDNETEISKEFDSCVDAVLRFTARHDTKKKSELVDLVNSRKHKLWINDNELEISDTKIGKGRHGNVFTGTLKMNGRIIDVAVKQQNFQLDSEMQRITTEIRALTLASMRCQRSCRIYGVTHKADNMCIVMKLYSDNLAALLERGPLPLAEALRLILALYQALAELHDAGIVSRDIKPSNLLLDRFGNLVVADFGISCILDSTATTLYLTDEQEAVGTCGYMPPEAFNPAQGVGPQSDVWSAACCAVEMLTGRPPFGAMSAQQVMFEVCLRRSGPAIPPAAASGERCPAALRSLLGRCFAWAKRNRPTAAAAVEELVAIRTDQRPDEHGVGEASRHRPTVSAPCEICEAECPAGGDGEGGTEDDPLALGGPEAAAGKQGRGYLSVPGEDDGAFADQLMVQNESRPAELAQLAPPVLSNEDLVAAREWSWQELGRLWRASAMQQRLRSQPQNAGSVTALLSVERAVLQALQFVFTLPFRSRHFWFLVWTALLTVSVAWRLGALPGALAPQGRDQPVAIVLTTGSVMGWISNATFIGKAVRYGMNITALASAMLSQSVLAAVGMLVVGAVYGWFVLKIGRQHSALADSDHTRVPPVIVAGGGHDLGGGGGAQLGRHDHDFLDNAEAALV
jgi:hypothetical protein